MTHPARTAVRVHHRSGWTLVEMMVAIMIISILAGLTLSIGSAVLGSSETRQTESLLKVLDSALAEYSEVRGAEPACAINGDPIPDGSMARGSRYDIDLELSLSGGSGCNGCSGNLGSFDYRNSAAGQAISDQDLICLQWCQVAGCSGSGEDIYEGVGALTLMTLLQHPASREILARIEPDLVERISVRTEDSEGDEEKQGIRPLDAWGKPVLIVYGGRQRDDGESLFIPPGGLTYDLADGTIRTRCEQMLGPARNGRAYFVSAGPDGKYGNLQYYQRHDEDFVPDVTDPGYQATLDNVYSYEVIKW